MNRRVLLGVAVAGLFVWTSAFAFQRGFGRMRGPFGGNDELVTPADANDKTVFNIREENPWIKVLDAVLGEIELIGPFIAMFINPRYLLEDEGGVLRYIIAKKRSFFGRNFTLEQVSKEENDQYDERLIALALIQTIFLEHRRG